MRHFYTSVSFVEALGRKGGDRWVGWGDGWGGVAMFLLDLIYVGFGVSVVCAGSLLLACAPLIVREFGVGVGCDCSLVVGCGGLWFPV